MARKIRTLEAGSFAPILDRAEAAATIGEHFHSEITALISLVDYGTNLIPRAMKSSKRELEDLIVLAVLLKQCVGMLDGLQILFSQGAVQAAHLQLRALFEASVYIDWVLKEDTEKRATSYYVWNLRRQRKWLLRAQPGTAEAVAMTRDFQGLQIESRLSSPEVQADVVRQLADVDRLLAIPDYTDLNTEFDKRRGTREFDPSWYEILFPAGRRVSLAALVKAVGRIAEYRLIYELGSEAMHSSRTDTHVRVSGTTVALRSVRDLSDFGLIAQFAMGEAIHTFLVVLKHYRDGEQQNFAKNYASKWRPVYLNPKKVNYSPDSPTVRI